MADLADAIRLAREQHRAGGEAVLDLLLRLPGARAEDVAAGLRAQAGVEVVLRADEAIPDFEALDMATAREWRCVVVRQLAGPLPHARVVAAEDPWDDALVQRVMRRLGMQLELAATTRAVLSTWVGAAPRSGEPGDGLTAAAASAAGPIVGFVDHALRAAYELGASDVHFECDRRGVTVKLRQDGVLVTHARMEGSQRAQEAISRLKVMAQLDITERRLPQDGRFRFDFGSAGIDLRVSIMPSVHGEDAVLRLLDKARLRSAQQALSLDRLGFAGSALTRIRELVARPSGMLLVTGPTGSGKTTTVYAALSEVNTGTEKLITIEDPVEYELAGVLQIPVNDRKGLTFAKGLRSILRHDPDRILVGEIRDAETAEIAVQSALTGHQVFTTVHANSLTDIVGRFRHFGLDMFGFTSSLNGVLVQRLLRVLCPHCARSRPLQQPEAAWLHGLGLEVPDAVPQAVGCELCRRSGFQGRFVVAEVHGVDDALRDQVTSGAPLSALKAHSAALGVEPLPVLAARHVLAGRTTLEEVRRVVGW
ncbi:MAG: type II/IV secretion system protein [Rhodoferax sp.]|nr:type II/IV secretion system protein [Rhodoferax sp.]